jgi:murein DD-endopeptidase MepM/ murein hydrolase activator NlpD
MKQVITAIVVAVAIGILREELTVQFRFVHLQMQPADATLLMPVEGVSVHRVADTWSVPRPGDRRHQGQDIFAPKGTPLLSATKGIVVRIGINSLGGKIVSVAGSGGRMYYYAHLDRYSEDLSAGDDVRPGSLIGYVGNTGNARNTPPHLHFGVYTAAGAINPLPILVDGELNGSKKPGHDAAGSAARRLHRTSSRS